MQLFQIAYQNENDFKIQNIHPVSKITTTEFRRNHKLIKAKEGNI